MILWKSSKQSGYASAVYHTKKECLEHTIEWNSRHINTELAHPVQVEVDHLESYQRLCSRCSKNIKVDGYGTING